MFLSVRLDPAGAEALMNCIIRDRAERRLRSSRLRLRALKRLPCNAMNSAAKSGRWRSVAFTAVIGKDRTRERISALPEHIHPNARYRAELVCRLSWRPTTAVFRTRAQTATSRDLLACKGYLHGPGRVKLLELSTALEGHRCGEETNCHPSNAYLNVEPRKGYTRGPR